MLRFRKVAVLSATTRRMPWRFAASSTLAVAHHVDRLEVGEVLTCPAQQRRTVDGRIGTLGRPKHIAGVADVALDQFDPDVGQCRGFVRIADQRADILAALDQLFADIAAGLAGGTGDEDRVGHGPVPSLHIEQI